MKKVFLTLFLLCTPSLLWAEPHTLLRCAQNVRGKARELRIDKNIQELRLYLYTTDQLIPHLASTTGAIAEEASAEIDFVLLRVPYSACEVTHGFKFLCSNFKSRFEFSSPIGGLISPDHILSLSFNLINTESDPLEVQLSSASAGLLLGLELEQADCSGNARLSFQFTRSIESYLDELAP